MSEPKRVEITLTPESAWEVCDILDTVIPSEWHYKVCLPYFGIHPRGTHNMAPSLLPHTVALQKNLCQIIYYADARLGIFESCHECRHSVFLHRGDPNPGASACLGCTIEASI